MKNSKLKNDDKCLLGLFAGMVIILILGLFYKYGNYEFVAKRKAIDLMNEANKRALIVSKKINNGSATIPFSQDEENSPEYIRAIDIVNQGSSANKFNIVFYYVDEEVCRQLVEIVGKDSIIREISPCDRDPLILTYYNDLSPIDAFCDSKECYCKNNAVYLPFLEEPCLYDIISSEGACRRNQDCEKGQYCSYAGGNNKVDPSIGSCEKINKTEELVIAVGDNQQTFYKGPAMSYWSINNFCKAQSMIPVSLEDVGCNKEGKCENNEIFKITGRFWVTDMVSEKRAYNLGKNNNPVLLSNPLNANIAVLCRDAESKKITKERGHAAVADFTAKRKRHAAVADFTAKRKFKLPLRKKK